jgi:DNA-directed RNA polymerase beta subunit
VAKAIMDDDDNVHPVEDGDAVMDEVDAVDNDDAMEEEEEAAAAAEEDDENDENIPVTQEDSWAVISAYFQEKGLVRQQLDSFDEFIQNTMQELVEDSSSLRVRFLLRCVLVALDRLGFAARSLIFSYPILNNNDTH